MARLRLLGILLGHLSLVLAAAVPRANLKRQVSALRDTYDFIVAGAGTTGLTVADRLSEAFPEKTVLVVEYGDIETTPAVFDPPSAGRRASAWDFQSLPVPALNNRSASVSAGRLVGGSSGVNGMFFDRGSKACYDAWEAVGSPEFDASKVKWNWEGIFPFFKKSVTFTEPSAHVVNKYGYTWDLEAFGGSTPIYSSFPPFQWADVVVGWSAWTDLGLTVNKECGGGIKEGLCWVPTSQHPITAARSHAGLGHYAAVKEKRANFDLLVRHQVVRVVYPSGETGAAPPLVEVRSLLAGANGQLVNVTAKAEVIIAAGALHTPTILQRSGIGQASFLKKASIPVVVDLPGVGANFQDHSGPAVSSRFTRPLDFSPTQSAMNDPDFMDDAIAGFSETPARGPFTLAMSNSAIYVSLPHITSNFTLITDKIRDQIASRSALGYLPAEYESDETLAAGYLHQLDVLAGILDDPAAPLLESPFGNGGTGSAFLLRPLSRGTVRLDLRNPLEKPIVDYRTASNPLDFDLHIANVRFMRRVFGTETMKKYGAVESAPGASAEQDEDIITYLRRSITMSFMHPCCTAAMMPRGKGGVVGPDLRVHGVKGLRVADISIVPLIPGTHTSSTAYAIGEKAADIIIKEWSA